MDVAVSSPQAVQRTRLIKQLEYAGDEVTSWDRPTAGLEAFFSQPQRRYA